MKNGEVLENSEDLIRILEQGGPAGPNFRIFDVVTNSMTNELVVGSEYVLLPASCSDPMNMKTIVDENCVAVFRNLHSTQRRLGKIDFVDGTFDGICLVVLLAVHSDSVSFYGLQAEDNDSPIATISHDALLDFLRDHFSSTTKDEIVAAYQSQQTKDYAKNIDEIITAFQEGAEVDINTLPEEFI